MNITTPLGEKLKMELTSSLRYNLVETKNNLLQHSEGLSVSLSGNLRYKLNGSMTISGSGGVSPSPYTL
jgi:hypothetical protein